MASVKGNNPGGHLILITGYSFIDKDLFINDPSAPNQPVEGNSTIAFSKFKHWFNHKGISIRINNVGD